MIPYYSASLASSLEYWRVAPGVFVSHLSQDKEMIFLCSCIAHMTNVRTELEWWAWALTPAHMEMSKNVGTWQLKIFQV